jgi:hypothetical protein
MSLEAGEHLPPAQAPELVGALTEAAPLVLFSAAVPGQGGDGHINEQPPSYWANLFFQRGYVCFADLRRRLWRADSVEVWYRQNMFCYVRGDDLDRWAGVLRDRIEPGDPMLDVVHPELLARQKARADHLAEYAERLQGEASCLRDERDVREFELRQCERKLRDVVESRAWRTWQAVSGPYYRLRNRNLKSGKTGSERHDQDDH